MNTYVYDVFELSFHGRTSGNPFTDYEIRAGFTGPETDVQLSGFYDGDGVYKVRFMPEKAGTYHYEVSGNFCDEATEQKQPLAGSFTVEENPDQSMHGKVQVADSYYLAYADGTPYYSIGTTCYAWATQNMELQEQTLDTLSKSSFNKIRFCIFPKFYRYNEHEPIMYPYERGEQRGIDWSLKENNINLPFHTDKEILDITDFDCFRFNTEYYRLLDQRIAQLCALGIEADIILFHPYDKWGFGNMTMECNELYLRYVTARFGAYSNVWWSMANEYDLTVKTAEQWETLAKVVIDNDPYHHMISIHNCIDFYDYKKEWITHCSMQRQDVYKCTEYTDEYLRRFGKPVVWDEIAYEGNINMGWGNITGEELVRRFWEASLRGGYAGHGETYENENDILWWSHGGVLHGNSEPRFAFMKQILEQTPGHYLKYVRRSFDEVVGVPYHSNARDWDVFQEVPFYDDYEVHYFGGTRPAFREFDFKEDEIFHVEIIDTWNMTVTDAGNHSGYTRINLPGTLYMAIRIRRVK
ncbi:MAG: DUF5060 domain-containing protein [Eubacteriales bacterium]|nr:DUF5060 domain-containing protein [Eubacteriales bacterium]